MSAKYLCRLCLEEAEQLLEIFSEIGEELKIKAIISQHLWFEVQQNDPISNKICTICWDKIGDFHEFYTKVGKAQESITILIDAKPDYAPKDVVIETNDSVEVVQQIQFADFKIESQQFEDHFGDDPVSDTEILTTPKEECPEEIQKSFDIPSPTDDIKRNPMRRVKKIKTDRYSRSRSKSPPKPKSEDAVCYKALDECMDCIDAADEYVPKSSIKRRGRKPIKKERREAEKKQEETLIESYYKMQCDICNNMFDSFQALYNHYDATHNIRGFIMCCGKKFFKRTAIAEHVLWHRNPELFKCTVCNKIYADKKCLSNHMLAHAPPDMKLFKCDHCPKSFVKKFKLKQHMLRHLTPEEKKHICDECDKPYASDALLRAHKRVVHDKTYAHMCEICAKVFKSRIFFEKHQLEHLGQNLPRVQCQICQVWMKNEHTMRAHMRLHQDADTVHICDICGKQGPSRNAILKHKRFVHFSERKFKCSLCDKAFKRAITLKEHMTVHTGEVLYTCTFCPKTFNSGANMHAHRKKAHPTEWEEEKRTKLLSMAPIESP